MANKTSVNIITLGCSKNVVDSEKIMGQLSPHRFSISHESNEPSDIVIINTCGFIKDAKEESIDAIIRLVEARKQGLVKDVIVTGCLSERYREELSREIPEVAAWFGARDPGELLEWFHQKYDARNPERLLSTPGHYAYLKISEGCDRTCSFCAIPAIRGKHRSVPVDRLVDEAGMLAGRGVKELVLIAQDLSYYGIDLAGRSQLAGLLRTLCEVEGIRWIRLHYAYPNNFPIEVLDVMRESSKICNYLDIPLQHINEEILRSMRRGHGKHETEMLVQRIRETVPGIALRTTLMLGYPGETEEAFRELMEFVSHARFERLGVFTYSPEEGTKAWELGDPVPESVKQKRSDALMEKQAEISMEHNSRKIGKVMQAVIDREEDDYYIGRTEFDSPEVDNEVFIEKSRPLFPGQFVSATVTDAAAFELFARPHGK